MTCERRGNGMESESEVGKEESLRAERRRQAGERGRSMDGNARREMVLYETREMVCGEGERGTHE